MNQQEQKYPADPQGGRLNADSAPFELAPNEWVNMENFRSGTTDAGQTGTMESIGSTLRLSALSPSQTFIPLGWADDSANRRFLTFLYNTTTSQHKIVCWSAADQFEYIVLLNSQVTGGLGWDKDYPIHSARVNNGVLYWTDNLNPPRKLNIDAAIKMNQPTFSTTQAAYTNPLEQEIITLIRKPPGLPLLVTKITTGGLTANNIVDFAGQFAWRYVGRDNEETVPSRPSILVPYNFAGSTLDSVNVVAPLDEQIPQDAQQVDVLVRVGNSGIYSIIKSWNKAIAADAAAIAAHNAGTTALNFLFLNDRAGIALSLAYSVKPYDSVPLLAEALETAENRLFLGNVLSGYVTPTITSLTITPHAETNHAPLQQTPYKSDAAYKFGIVFRDKYKRVIGGVVTNDTLKVQIPDRDYNYTTYYNYAQWNLSNAAATTEIPIDAYYYDIVITKNLRTRFFIQSVSTAMKYAVKNPVTGVLTYQDTYGSGANIYALAIDASQLYSAGLGYSFQEGDLVKLWVGTSIVIYKSNVIGQDGNYILCSPLIINLGFLSGTTAIYEVYSPYKEQVNEPFYTEGEYNCLPITNAGTGGRVYSLTSSNIYGDTYAIFNQSIIAEYMSPSNKFWQNWYSNWGEPNFVFLSNQLRKNVTIQWSNVLIPGTRTNGLSTFDALDEKTLPQECGALEKLITTSKVENQQGGVMLGICEDETASMYLGEVQLYGSNQPSTLSQAPQVIGTINVLKGSYGTVNPESVVEFRGTVYWYDARNNRIIQYAGNGLFPISNYQMTRFWRQFSIQYLSMTKAQIEALGSRPFIFMAVDPYHNELLISIPKLLNVPPKGYLPDYPNTIYPFDIWDGQGKVIVFQINDGETVPHFQGSYSFNPEMFAILEGKLYSNKAGLTYLHNQTSSYNNFYGVQYNSKIMVVSNQFPSVPKVYDNISVEANMQPYFVYFYNDYPEQQSSDLVDFDPNWKNYEGVFYAAIYRNKLIPTATGFTSDGLLTGQKMRNVAMYVMFEFAPTTVPTELKYLFIGYNVSRGNNNVTPK